MERPRRATKTTRGQYEIYLNELRNNKTFRDNKFNGSDPQVIKRSWENLTNRLNAAGGPIKDVAGWKRAFTDWKSQVRNKARKLRALRLETGNVGTPLKSLTDLEEQLLNLTGPVVVDGMDIPELGIDTRVVNITSAAPTPNPPPSPTPNLPPSPTPNPLPSPTLNPPPSPTPNPPPSPHDNNMPEDRPSCSHWSSTKTAPQKRKRSLFSYVETMLSASQVTQPTLVQSNEICNILKEININTRELVKVQRKKLKLKQLELQVKYPDYEFILSSSEEDS